MSAVEWGDRTAERRINPHHLAWGILLASFLLFCLLLLTMLLAANHYLFQSALPMKVTLNVGRGTVSISNLANPVEQVGIAGSGVADGVIVRTDPQSQGAILFLDGEGDDERLLASLTLQRDSRVTLLNAERPRFSWSRRGYEINLLDVIGVINLTVTDHAGPGMQIRGRTPGGARLLLTGPGTYTIQGAAPELRLFNHNGRVQLESADGRQIRIVPVGGQGAVLYEEARVEVRPGYRKLLQDQDFSQLRSGADAAEGSVWACGHNPDDIPAGSQDFVAVNGLQPLRFLRDGGVTSHGGNFCVQNFGQGGLELKELNLDLLSLRVTFSLENASLGTCGTAGSECPLMLRMDYIYFDEEDQERKGQQWFHGFYIRSREGWPQRCSTCLQDHDLIHDKSWYVYESPNLLTLFSPDPPPETIVSVWVYASGHEYDVRIQDVALLGLSQLAEDA